MSFNSGRCLWIGFKVVVFCIKKTKQDKENPTLGIFEIKASGNPASFYGSIR